MADNNKDKKSSTVPGIPDYYGTGGEVKGWLDQNLSTYLESNPGLIQAKAILGGAQAGFCPAGASISYGGDTAPSGWVMEDGASYDAVTNPGMYLNLYTVIGIKYGGTGQADFKVPDSRGRVDVMIGAHADVSTLGNNDGNANANRSYKHTMSNNLSTSGGTLSGAPGGTFLTTFNKVVHATQAGADNVLDTSTTFSSGSPTAGTLAVSGISVTGTIGLTTGAARPTNGPAAIVKNRIMKL